MRIFVILSFRSFSVTGPNTTFISIVMRMRVSKTKKEGRMCLSCYVRRR